MKIALRHKYLTKRNNLLTGYAEESGKKASEIFLSSALSNIPEEKSIMIYSDFKNEISTGWLIKQLYSAGKMIILPYTEKNIIHPFIYCGADHMITDKFGIPSPDKAHCVKAELNNIHTVIVPGLAFDVQGNRIGFGKGCYDEFLPRIPQAIKIGLCYRFQVCSQLPHHEKDIPMDWLLTEEGLTKCERHDTANQSR